MDLSSGNSRRRRRNRRGPSSKETPLVPPGASVASSYIPEDVLAAAKHAGYAEHQILRAIDELFESGGQYDSPEAVLQALRQNSRSTSGGAAAGAAAGGAAAAAGATNVADEVRHMSLRDSLFEISILAWTYLVGSCSKRFVCSNGPPVAAAQVRHLPQAIKLNLPVHQHPLRHPLQILQV